jgi:hypothetical protein
VDGLTKAGMTRTGWTFPIAAMICFGFFWFARTKIIGPLRGHARRVFRHPRRFVGTPSSPIAVVSFGGAGIERDGGKAAIAGDGV